ncbi:restriction endonuclease S subunits-like protein [Alcanivorax balearicus MACL04]|uniref:Restriction endonuclease S subunits-like protein n=1 Tax=Alloalcanivorax balearicus MACL04 TaxID=1177182 RepID=A0ABT2QY93_9GAMM|nr:restriction endonuclease subunit S [Alloalcanivorax balearicus]MCU5782500.1 restriction endonuclease S subunits-like protein [Alloalcanivorax balearicus MACL04]
MSAELVMESSNTWAIETLHSLTAELGLFKDGDWVESKDQDPNGEVRLIQLADIGDGQFIDKSSRFLTKDKAKELRCTFLKKGDLLIARMPGPLGRACIFPLEGEHKYVTVVDICIVRANPKKVDTKYLMYLLNSPDIREKIESLKSGSTRKRISRGNLSIIELPIASLEEQKDIVAKIETLFSELDKGIESLKTARQQLKAYRQAVLKHAFEGKLTEQWRQQNPGKLETSEHHHGGEISGEELANLPRIPAEWKYARLGDYILGIEAGKSFKCDEREPSAEEIGVAKVSAVTWGEYDESESKTCMDPSKVNENYFINKGDFLLSRANTIELVGACVVAKNVTKRVMLSDKTLRITFSCLLSGYFLYWLRSPKGRDEIMHRSTGNQESMRNIGQSRIKSIVFPLCSAKEAEEIVRVVEQQEAQIQKLDEEVACELVRAETVRQSILGKAFSGSLII